MADNQEYFTAGNIAITHVGKTKIQLKFPKNLTENAFDFIRAYISLYFSNIIFIERTKKAKISINGEKTFLKSNDTKSILKLYGKMVNSEEELNFISMDCEKMNNIILEMEEE